MDELAVLGESLRSQARKLLPHRVRATRQLDRFRALVQFAWDNSPFYRELYSSHGLTRLDLLEVETRDIPIVDKPILMSALGDVFTDRDLKPDEVGAWIAANPHPLALYRDKYQVMHTSGSSGKPGVFVYDRNALTALRGSLIATPVTHLRLSRKARIAYVGATHGRFSGVIMAASAPNRLFDTLLLSVLDPVDENVTALNDFQPDMLIGYARTIASLAHMARSNELAIRPSRVVVSGEALTASSWDLLEDCWASQIVNFYSSTESAIGISQRRDGWFQVLHDLCIAESVPSEGEGGERNVAITNLYNRVTPIIRYRLNDEVVPGDALFGTVMDGIRELHGRRSMDLPIRADNGDRDTVHHITLVELFVPGVDQFQFVSVRPGEVLIRYVAGQPLDAEVRREFDKILKPKAARRGTRVLVERVPMISPNTTTGKHELVCVPSSGAGHA